MAMVMNAVMPPQPPLFLTEERLLEFAREDVNQWQARNKRILRHRKLFECVKPDPRTLKPGQIAAVTNDGKSIPRKMASAIAKRWPSVDITARDQAVTFEAQRSEEYVRFWRDQTELLHGRGPNGSRRYQEAEYCVRDGMVVDLTVVDHNNQNFPFKSMLLDPMTVNPIYEGNDRVRTTVISRVTWGEVRSRFKDQWQQFVSENPEYDSRKASDRTDMVQVYAKNPDTGVWEIGVLVAGKMIFADVLGYDPLTITYAAGRSYSLSMQPDADGPTQWENVGVGIFDLIEEPLMAKNQTYSMIKEMLARETNPAKIIFSDDEGVQEKVIEPGQNVHLWAEDKFQLASLNPDLTKFETALNMDQQGLERGSLGKVLWGESGGDSGTQDYMSLGNARDQFYVYTAAMERYYTDLWTKILELVRDQPMLGELPFSGRTPDGIKLAGQAFSQQDVQALGPNIDMKVEYSEVTPQNEMVRVQMAATATDKKLLDLEDARKLLPAPFNENPELVNEKVLQDLVFLNPMVTQIMAMASALLSPNELVRGLATMMLPKMVGDAQMASAGAGQQPGQPGADGNAPPPSNPNPTAAANPAELGNQAGRPEGMPAPPQPGSDQPQGMGM